MPILRRAPFRDTTREIEDEVFCFLNDFGIAGLDASLGQVLGMLGQLRQSDKSGAAEHIDLGMQSLVAEDFHATAVI